MRAAGEPFRCHSFELACADLEIEHRLTKPNHPWTNGQVERMNRTLKEATVRRYHYAPPFEASRRSSSSPSNRHQSRTNSDFIRPSHPETEHLGEANEVEGLRKLAGQLDPALRPLASVATSGPGE